ncbi:hypothetical protein EAT51_04325 [Pseudoxanthomonas winnipegensis]|uniref:hyaluronate lyase N-terminal domain-containing protein n=1 Tax=Pseudoxanthomonas winnipegensis TaxID=2480810 RepID=UPI00102D6CF5|nr:hypothetical protein [Pseudoxanthomonas winnipegensis]TAA42931.1 hypothetical protein EAT51_04325 [Pseudoxanthomonas winnipegensis]
MSLVELPYRFRVRGGTAADLVTVNEIPLERELVVEVDTGKMKLGDGVTAWIDLDYISSGGADGLEMRVNAGYVQYTTDGTLWHDLIATADLAGPPGDPGAPGDDGAPGAPGEPGEPGADGREIELQRSGSYIQWRYVGAPTWANLVPLSDITGPPGADAVGAASRTTVTINSGSGSVTLSKLALLLRLVTSAEARCRFYCSAAARDADASRAATVAAAQGAGLLLEFISTSTFLGAPLTPGVIAYNLDSPVTGSIYYNIQPVGGAMTVDLTYLALEH